MKKSLQLGILSICLSLLWILSGCSSNPTPASSKAIQGNTPALSTEKISNDRLTIAEVEALTGFESQLTYL